jgi:hypothetical protein
MNTMLSWVDYWNRQVKKCTILDIKLAQLWAVGFILIIVKLLPQIMELSVRWFVGVMAVCVPRFAYVLWVKEGESTPRVATRGMP